MARGYGFTPSASYLQQQQASQNRYAAPKASAPTAPTQQPAAASQPAAQPPATPSQPWNPNLARILWARSGVADPVNAWRNNPYQGGLAPTMPSVPRPGPQQPSAPSTAQPIQEPSQGTPYNPGQPSVGGWPDYGEPKNRGLKIDQDRQRALQDSRSRMPIQLRAPSEGSASPQPPVQSPAPSLGSFGQGMPQDPMTQMWQQSMNAWAMPKQQLLGWGQQMQQMPWGPNYANTPDSRPSPWSQQVTGMFGNNQQDMWNNIGGFIQGVNSQAAQKPVGVYQGQGNPGPQYGKQTYDIRSLINQGNQMVQGGWQNPFAQPGGGGSQPGGSQQRPGLTDDGQWIAADGTRLGNQQAGMDYDQYLKGDRSVPWSVYSRTPRHLRGTNPNSWTDSQWREYQDARHYEPEDVGGLYRGQDGNVYLSGGMPVPGRGNSPTRIMPSSGRPGAAQPIQQPSQGTQYGDGQSVHGGWQNPFMAQPIQTPSQGTPYPYLGRLQ